MPSENWYRQLRPAWLLLAVFGSVGLCFVLFQLWVRWQLDSAFSQEPAQVPDVSGTAALQIWTIGKQVGAVSFSPDGQLLAIGTSSGEIELRRVSDGSVLRTLHGHASRVKALVFSPDGQLLASGEGHDWQAEEPPRVVKQDAQVHLWRLTDGKILQTWDGFTEGEPEQDPVSGIYRTEAVDAVAFSPGGETIASGGTDGLVHLWAVVNGQPLESLAGPTHTPVHEIPFTLAITFSQDGLMLTAGDVEDTVQKWKLPEGHLVHNQAGSEREHTSNIARSMAFSPDGQIVATTYNFLSDVYVWRLESGEEVFELHGHYSNPWSLAFSPDGQLLASGGGRIVPEYAKEGYHKDDTSIHLWRMSDGQEQSRFTGHTDSVRSLAWSPDGKLLASGSDDGTVRLWQVK